MCGIAGVHVKERYKGSLPLDNILDYLLVGIEERGRHATGFVSVHFGGKGVTLSKKDVPASRFLRERARPNMQHVQTILAHTRLATLGEPDKHENNHPVVFGTTFVTHNGHITNHAEVVKEYDLDKARPAEVDTIAIPIALASCGLDTIPHIQDGLGKLAGNMACAVIDPIKHPGQVILAKGSTSPLIVLHHKTGFYWASTKAALEFMWGTLVGTPPQKEAKDPTQLGWYEFKYGEAWLIDGDEAAPFKFSPAIKKWTGNRSNSDSWLNQGASSRSGGGSSSGGFQTGTIAGLRNYTRYTCAPSARECSDPCEGGCLTGIACTCKEAIWNYAGKEYRFDPSEIIRAGWAADKAKREADRRSKSSSKEATTDAVLPCSTPRHCGAEGKCDCRRLDAIARAKEADRQGDTDGPDTATSTLPDRELVEGKVRCDFCWDWYNESNLIPVTVGATPFILCAECAIEEGWGHMVNEAVKDVDEGKADDKDVILDHYQDVAEAAQAAHELARETVCKEHKCRPEFVDWILFQATLTELNDPENGETLRALRRVVEDAYEHAYDQAIASGS